MYPNWSEPKMLFIVYSWVVHRWMVRQNAAWYLFIIDSRNSTRHFTNELKRKRWQWMIEYAKKKKKKQFIWKGYPSYLEWKFDLFEIKAHVLCKNWQINWNMHTNSKYHDYCNTYPYIVVWTASPFLLLCSNVPMSQYFNFLVFQRSNFYCFCIDTNIYQHDMTRRKPRRSW